MKDTVKRNLMCAAHNKRTNW